MWRYEAPTTNMLVPYGALCYFIGGNFLVRIWISLYASEFVSVLWLSCNLNYPKVEILNYPSFLASCTKSKLHQIRLLAVSQQFVSNIFKHMAKLKYFINTNTHHQGCTINVSYTPFVTCLISLYLYINVLNNQYFWYLLGKLLYFPLNSLA